MTKLIELFNSIKKLSIDAVSTLLDAVNMLLVPEGQAPKSDCPYCGSSSVIRYGHKCRKQRFLCKLREKAFVTTTHTIMSQSHFQEDIWQEVISDTIHGNAIDYSAKRLGINHQTVSTCTTRYC